MEVGRGIPKPRSSLIKLLLHQVEEQSELCNLTVKVGEWEKNFHRCVLTASPFFENAINGNFLEKQRGIVEISVGKPKYVEMALRFLYGIKPDLTIDTVWDLLEMAEFFMIKSLKYVCIRWLRHLHITQENCMHVLQVSSLFDFEVESCIKYIESHLSEVLTEADAKQLSKDSVQYFFSDPKFSYVPMDERLRFLVNWFKQYPEERKHNLNDLFETIDLSEVSESVWEDTKRVTSFDKAVDLEHAGCMPEGKNPSRKVLIMTGANDFIWCLDFKKNQWYRLKSELFQKTTFYGGECKDITGIKQIRNSCSEIYFGSKFDSQVITSNLETNETNTYTLISIDDDRNNFKTINVKGKTVFACVDVTNYKEKTIHPVFSQQLKPQKRNVCMVSSVLCKGYLFRQNVKMTPILSLLDEEISKICIGYNSVALLLKSKQAVIIFDSADYQMEKIDLALDKNDEIVRYKDGFLIFNIKRCHCLSKLRGPSLSEKYLLEEIELEKDEMWFLRYIFSRGIWLRLVRKDRTDDLKLQYVFHQSLIASKSSHGVHWEELSMPKEIEGFCLQILKTNLFLVPLSKSKLRGRIVCPHCGPRLVS